MRLAPLLLAASVVPLLFACGPAPVDPFEPPESGYAGTWDTTNTAWRALLTKLSR